MGCGLAAPEQECEIARIVRVAAKPTHTLNSLRWQPSGGNSEHRTRYQPHAAPEQ